MQLFSIIIPLHNKQRVIKTTLKSLLNQSFKDYEIIIINDGSTDDSLKIINNFHQASKIKIITQKNLGVSAARNRGISEAKGEWIAFLDADDWWHPQYLQFLSNAIQQNPDLKMFGTAFVSKADSVSWQPKPWEIAPLSHLETINGLPQRWLQGIPFFTSSICIKRSLLESFISPFMEGESHGEDLDLWFRIAEQYPIGHIQTPLVVYRTDQLSSLSNNKPTEQTPLHIKTMLQRLKNNETPVSLRKQTQNFIAHHYLSLARQNIILGRRLNALRLTLKATTAIQSKRWFMTLIMIFLSSNFVKRWTQKHSGRQEIDKIL